MDNLENKEQKRGYTIKFAITGTNYDTSEEVIAILKNYPTMTRIKWIEYFEIFLGQRKPEYKGVIFNFKEEEFFENVIQDWHDPYNKWIPKWTKEELFVKIDSIPAFTKEEIEQKYNGEKLEKALYYLK